MGRFWELLTGGLVAVALSNIVISNMVAVSMRLTGLIFISLAMLMYEKTTGFPGIAAVLPVLGACLLLFASNSKKDVIYKALAFAPVRFMGKISYSLYLWHWPLLVYARIMWPNLTGLQTGIVLLIAVLLATVTTYGLENPVRFKKILKSNVSFLATMGFVLSLVLVPVLLTVSLKGIPARWDYKGIDLQSIEYNFDDAFNVGSCFIDDRHTLAVLLNAGCLKPKSGKANVLIVGDSFAAHLMPGLEHHFPKINFNQATASACRALQGFGDRHFRKKWPCPDLNRLVFSKPFLTHQKYSAIVLASDWQYGYDGKLDGPALLETISYIETLTDIPVIVLGNTPVYKSNTHIKLRSHVISGYSMNDPLIFREGLLEMEAYYRKEIHSKFNSVTFVSMLESFCVDTTCPILTEDKKMIHFGIHLTEWGAIEVIGAARAKLYSVFSSLEMLDANVVQK